MPFPAERKRIDIGDFYADITKVAASPRLVAAACRCATGCAATVDYYRRHREHYL